MKHKFYGVNSIDDIEIDYSEHTNTDIVYVDLDVQSNTRKTSEKIMLLLSEEQIIHLYEQIQIHRRGS